MRGAIVKTPSDIANELINFEAMRGTPQESQHAWAWHRAKLAAEIAQHEALEAAASIDVSPVYFPDEVRDAIRSLIPKKLP